VCGTRGGIARPRLIAAGLQVLIRAGAARQLGNWIVIIHPDKGCRGRAPDGTWKWPEVRFHILSHPFMSTDFQRHPKYIQTRPPTSTGIPFTSNDVLSQSNDIPATSYDFQCVPAISSDFLRPPMTSRPHPMTSYDFRRNPRYCLSRPITSNDLSHIQ